jgi:Ala-tRNA(Pro) deacylase
MKTNIEDTYTQLIALLDQHGVCYRLIDHAPEGRTELVSPMRGNALSQAAKCIILMVKIGKKITRYVLAVVPGDAKVDLQALKALMRGTYVAFASTDIAERLAGSVTGTVLPFSFNPELELVVDPSLLENDEIYFNAARLDRSLVLKTSDYVALAKPRLGRIAESRGASPDAPPGS